MSINLSDALTLLLDVRAPVEELKKVTLDIPHDYAGPHLIITRAHIAHAIELYLKGNISDKDLESWADLVEGRSGLELEEGDEDVLSEVIADLSTPDIRGALTLDRCQDLLEQLSGRSQEAI